MKYIIKTFLIAIIFFIPVFCNASNIVDSFWFQTSNGQVAGFSGASSTMYGTFKSIYLKIEPNTDNMNIGIKQSFNGGATYTNKDCSTGVIDIEDLGIEVDIGSGANEILILPLNGSECTFDNNSFIAPYYVDSVGASNSNASFTGYSQYLITNEEANLTRIISVSPYDQQTIATGTPITISTSVYINASDLTSDTIVRQKIILTNAPVLGNIWGGTGDWVAQQSETLVFEYPVSSSGSLTFSTTTTFSQIGQRTFITEIIDPDIVPFIDLFDNIIVSSTTQFLVGTTTTGDAITQSISESLATLSNPASTTVDSINIACNPFSGNFDMVLCAWRMVVPDQQTATALFQQTYDMVFSRAPLGYFTDFISIMATSTVGSLTIIDATVPQGLIGTGAHITLDLTGVLDPYLYSTTTLAFSSNGADSSDTLYDQTYYYWRIIISILFVLYVIRRILGAHIIPHNMFGDSGALSDTNNSDDSYRLKEYLYKHRNERHK